MREFTQEFTDHIKSGSTSLAWCWRIRRKDGIVLGFTDHDEDITCDGTIFSPAHGADTSAVTERQGSSVSTSEIIGIIHAQSIDEDDIMLGRFDAALVETLRVNWQNTAEFAYIRRDEIGEIIQEDKQFRVELRSAQHKLNQVQGRIYRKTCDAILGEKRCGVDLNAPTLWAQITVKALTGDMSITCDGIAHFASNWLAHGKVKWLSGRRIGCIDVIVQNDANELDFEKPIKQYLSVNDIGIVTAGCMRSSAMCSEKFDNIANFQGFPHIPGADFLMRYPNNIGTGKALK